MSTFRCFPVEGVPFKLENVRLSDVDGARDSAALYNCTVSVSVGTVTFAPTARHAFKYYLGTGYNDRAVTISGELEHLDSALQGMVYMLSPSARLAGSGGQTMSDSITITVVDPQRGSATSTIAVSLASTQSKPSIIIPQPLGATTAKVLRSVQEDGALVVEGLSVSLFPRSFPAVIESDIVFDTAIWSSHGRLALASVPWTP